MPLLTVVPAFWMGRAYWIAIVIPCALFFAWNPRLLFGATNIPLRSIALFALAAAFSIYWFFAAWRYGVEYQGWWHTYLMVGFNVVWIALIGFLCRRRDVSFARNLLFHWMLFAWLGWYAFPYLGDLP
jgi:hypothetical protein